MGLSVPTAESCHSSTLTTRYPMHKQTHQHSVSIGLFLSTTLLFKHLLSPIGFRRVRTLGLPGRDQVAHKSGHSTEQHRHLRDHGLGEVHANQSHSHHPPSRREHFQATRHRGGSNFVECGLTLFRRVRWLSGNKRGRSRFESRRRRFDSRRAVQNCCNWGAPGVFHARKWPF